MFWIQSFCVTLLESKFRDRMFPLISFISKLLLSFLLAFYYYFSFRKKYDQNYIRLSPKRFLNTYNLNLI